MNKLRLNNNNEDKKIITFTINKKIKDQLKEILITSEHYNLKKKTDWVNEAIVMLRENPDYKLMASNAEGSNEDFVFDKIYMTFSQRCVFAEMRNDIVKEYPDIKGPQGAIVRAAILSRLLRKNKNNYKKVERDMIAEKVIRKHVAIIHAYSLMSALQRKVVNVLLYEAINNHEHDKESVAVECRIPFNILAKNINFNSNNTKYLKEAIDGLASIKIEWNLLKDKVPTDISFLNLRVLHGSPTFYQDGTFNYSFHKVMLDLANNPSIYGTIDLDVQAKFESKYGHALYENSTRFVNLQKNKIIQLDTFRQLLGVENNKYQSMRELTRNVIAPAIEEVNDRADFVVNLDSIRVGRKVYGYEISVNSKNKSTSNIHYENKVENEKINQEINEFFGEINNNVMKNILSSYSEEYILEKIDYTKKHAKKEQTGLYPIPYFISALKLDYKSSEKNKNNEQIKQDNESSDVQIWFEKERLLKADLTHWKKIYELTQASNNQQATVTTQEIMAKSEEKLRTHYLEKPTLENEAA